jgi:hypothetical protein
LRGFFGVPASTCGPRQRPFRPPSTPVSLSPPPLSLRPRRPPRGEVRKNPIFLWVDSVGYLRTFQAVGWQHRLAEEIACARDRARPRPQGAAAPSSHRSGRTATARRPVCNGEPPTNLGNPAPVGAGGRHAGVNFSDRADPEPQDRGHRGLRVSLRPGAAVQGALREGQRRATADIPGLAPDRGRRFGPVVRSASLPYRESSPFWRALHGRLRQDPTHFRRSATYGEIGAFRLAIAA